MIIPQIRGALVLALALALLGCTSTYRSPNLITGDESKIAVLEDKDYSPFGQFNILAIDGNSRGIGWFNRFELKPGRRSVTAGVTGLYLRSDNITRYFNARAGVRYHFVVDVNYAMQRWNFSIVEAETGERVDSPY